MSVAPSQGNGDGNGNQGNQNGDGNGTGDQGNQGANQQQGAANQPELTDDQLNQLLQDPKILENENLWKHPRLAELRQSAAELKKLRDKSASEEQERLSKQGEWEKLAQQREDENKQLKSQIQEFSINQALTAKLVGQGVVDMDAALKLVDRSKLEIADDGTVKGVDKAIDELKSGKSYLFGEGTGPVGQATNNNGGGSQGPAKFKRSQLRDRKFYEANRDAILEAHKAGLIEDDIS